MDEQNRQYAIEVQVSDEPSFVNRSLYAEAHNCFMTKHITHSEGMLTEDLAIHYIEL